MSLHPIRALDLARKPQVWVTKCFTKPVVTVWQELGGNAVLRVETR